MKEVLGDLETKKFKKTQIVGEGENKELRMDAINVMCSGTII